MNKDKITSNDVLDALSMRVNDVLRPGRKDNKKNNPYFWIFKVIFLVIYILLFTWLFDAIRDLGVALIYTFSDSLRSILSYIWVFVIGFMKNLFVLSVLYESLKSFIGSSYYKILYENDKAMLCKKEKVFKGIDLFIKILAGILLTIVACVSAISMFTLVYLIIMFINGVYIISPILIVLSIFAICYFTFKLIQNKFFNSKIIITKNHFVLTICVLIVGILAFSYETSSFEYKNGLPNDFQMVHKSQVFKINKNQNIILKNNSKLDNLKVITDNNLKGEIRVEFDYCRTADVRYVYQFNDENDLKLYFTSSLNFEADDCLEVIKLFVDTFNQKTIYNYNLFKYPNIYVYVNSENLNQISIKK